METIISSPLLQLQNVLFVSFKSDATVLCQTATTTTKKMPHLFNFLKHEKIDQKFHVKMEA